MWLESKYLTYMRTGSSLGTRPEVDYRSNISSSCITTRQRLFERLSLSCLVTNSDDQGDDQMIRLNVTVNELDQATIMLCLRGGLSWAQENTPLPSLPLQLPSLRCKHGQSCRNSTFLASMIEKLNKVKHIDNQLARQRAV